MNEAQLDLYAPLQEPPRARRTDNNASHAAADKISGTRAGRQKLSLLRAISVSPGATTAELAALGLVVRHDAARRAPEMEKAGLIRRDDSEDGFRLYLTDKGLEILKASR